MIIYGALIFVTALSTISAQGSGTQGAGAPTASAQVDTPIVNFTSAQAFQSQFSSVSISDGDGGGQGNQPDVQITQQQASSSQFQSVSVGDDGGGGGGGVGASMQSPSSPMGSLPTGSLSGSGQLPQLPQIGLGIGGPTQSNQAQQSGGGPQSIAQSNDNSDYGSPPQSNTAQQFGSGPQSVAQSNDDSDSGGPQSNQAQQYGGGPQNISQSNYGSPSPLYDTSQTQPQPQQSGGQGSPYQSPTDSTQYPQNQNNGTGPGSGSGSPFSYPGGPQMNYGMQVSSGNQPQDMNQTNNDNGQYPGGQANVGFQVGNGPQNMNQSNNGGSPDYLSPNSTQNGGPGGQQYPMYPSSSSQTPQTQQPGMGSGQPTASPQDTSGGYPTSSQPAFGQPYPPGPPGQLNIGVQIGPGPQTMNQGNYGSPQDTTQQGVPGQGQSPYQNQGSPSPSTMSPSSGSQSQPQTSSPYGSPTSTRGSPLGQGQMPSPYGPTGSSSPGQGQNGQGPNGQGQWPTPDTTTIVITCTTYMSMVESYNASQGSPPPFATGESDVLAQHWAMDVYYTCCKTIINSECAMNMATASSTDCSTCGTGASANVGGVGGSASVGGGSPSGNN